MCCYVLLCVNGIKECLMWSMALFTYASAYSRQNKGEIWKQDNFIYGYDCISACVLICSLSILEVDDVLLSSQDC